MSTCSHALLRPSTGEHFDMVPQVKAVRHLHLGNTRPHFRCVCGSKTRWRNCQQLQYRGRLCSWTWTSMDVKLSDKMNVSDSGALLNQSEKGCIGADDGTLRLTRLSVVALPCATQGCSSLVQRFSAGEHCDTVPQVNAVRHLHFEDTRPHLGCVCGFKTRWRGH